MNQSVFKPLSLCFLFSFLILTLPLQAFDNLPGFPGTVRSLDASSRTLLVEGEIPGYGARTSVMMKVSGVHDRKGTSLEFTDLAPGDRIFVWYDGMFLESLPLQLMGPVIVIKEEKAAELPTLVKQEAVVRMIHPFDDNTMHLYVSTGASEEATLIVHVRASTKLPEKTLAPGDEIVVSFDGKTLESFPPQITAIAIEVRVKDAPEAAPQAKGFPGVVTKIWTRGSDTAFLFDGDIPGYGRTQCSFTLDELLDARGRSLPHTDLKVGQQVRVDYHGMFFETYPLKGGKAKVILP